ncbi:MAG TPA: universal stress protein [Solirubrobacterales bacterium]
MPEPDADTTIVVGVDHRPASEDALALGRLLAAATGARVVPATVSPSSGSEDDPPPVADARRVESSSPAKGLHELAEAERAGIVVLGSTDRGTAGRIYPGSVAERLLSGAPCAIAVAPRGYARRETDRLRVIEVGFDGSPESRHALGIARELALASGGTMRIFAAFETGPDELGPLGVEARDELAEALRAAVEEIPEEVRPLGRLVDGNPVEVLATQAEAGVDLLVLGSRSYGPLRAALLGGVSAKVLRRAPCPVLVVPRGRGEEARARSI